MIASEEEEKTDAAMLSSRIISLDHKRMNEAIAKQDAMLCKKHDITKHDEIKDAME